MIARWNGSAVFGPHGRESASRTIAMKDFVFFLANGFSHH
jgi:hypothetical protein